MDKKFWGTIIVIMLIMGGIYWAETSNHAAAPNSSKPTSHIEGQGKDNVTLVEYGDYECPYCGQYFPIVKQVVALYSPYIYFQFRNLPLTQIHQNAFAGARAAEAAALQNKFWQMHDMLYQNQSQWVSSPDPEPIFVIYAKQLGLNTAKFKQDFASTQVNNSINADVTAFTATKGQEATPTFFLDGKQIQPAESVASFAQYLNATIQKKTGKPSPVQLPSSAPTSGSQTAPAPQSKP